MAADACSRRALGDAIATHRSEFLETLMLLLRQPSISVQDIGVTECAKLVCSIMQENGLHGEILQTAGAPVVFGQSLVDPSANTLLIYGHYDVQPPEPLEAWTTPPFEPTLRHGRVYARGVGDNKGQFLAHILALRVLSKLGRRPHLNVKLLLEGEEEYASPNLPAFVRANQAKLEADVLYAADGPAHLSGRPAISLGNRGTLKAEVIVRGARRDVHSGLYGGVAPNAIWQLVDLLGGMRGSDGRVTIDGFYDGIVEPTETDRRLMTAIPLDEAAVVRELGVDKLAEPSNVPYQERVMFRPTFNVTGISGGYAGKGAKSVIPATAIAKLECRLAPGQDPDVVFAKIARHIAAHATGVEARKLGGTRPSRTATDLPVVRALIDAISEAYEEDPVVLPLMGGSSPNYLFTEVLHLPTIWATYGAADQNGHAPDENMPVAAFERGILASALVMERLAAMPHRDLVH